MKVLVTGATGFIGSHVVEKLAARGHDVHALVRSTTRRPWSADVRVTLHEGDLTRPESIVPAVRGAGAVYHLAAVLRSRTSAEYHDVNREGTAAVAAAVRSAAGGSGGRPRLVYVSSQAAGGPSLDGHPVSSAEPPRPISEYGRTKLAGEEVIREALGDRGWVVLRPPSVYGPRERDILTAFKLVNLGIIPVLGGGRQRIPLIHVDDLAEATVLAGESRVEGRIYYVTDGDLRTFREIFEAMARALDRRSSLRVPVPLWLLDVVGAAGQLWMDATGRPVALNRDKALEFRAPHWTCDDGPIRQELGFKPRFNLDAGLADTVRWYRDNRWL